MSVQSVTQAGRRAAEARMTSRATVRRKSDRVVQDEATGREYHVWDVIHADVPMRLADGRGGAGPSRTITVADTELQVATRIAHFPASLTDFADGDLIEVTSGENAGVVLRVIEADWADQKTARRMPVIAAERPEEWA